MTDIEGILHKKINEDIQPLENYLDKYSEKYGYDISSNQNILFKIIEDSIDLIKGIYIDSYMYEYSMKNYNNAELFLGNYYVDYSLVKIDMLVERFVKCLCIIYEIKFNKTTSTRTLHKKIYDSNRVPIKMKNMANMVIDKAWKESRIKEIRNQNEHDLSSHLEDNFYAQDLNGDYYLSYDKNNTPYISNKVQKEYEEEVSRLVREQKRSELNEVLEILPNIEDIFREMLKSVLLDENLNDIKVPIAYESLYDDFNDMGEYLADVKAGRNFIVEFNDHFYEMKKNRDIVNALSNKISTDSRLVFMRPPTLQIIKYNVDSVYRIIELIRSILNSLYAENNRSSNMIDFKITSSLYYFDYALLRLYSCIEKIGKLLYTRFELDDYMGNRLDMRNKYIDDILKSAEDEKMQDIYPVRNLTKIIRSDNFRRYRKHRNLSYHIIRPEFLLDHEDWHKYYVYILALMSDILNDIVTFYKNFEYGEGYTLVIHQLIRDSGL